MLFLYFTQRDIEHFRKNLENVHCIELFNGNIFYKN